MDTYHFTPWREATQSLKGELNEEENSEPEFVPDGTMGPSARFAGPKWEAIRCVNKQLEWP